MPELGTIIVRSVIAFIVLIIMTRIMGKKQLSQLTFFDYCVGITIGSIAAATSYDTDISLSEGIVALLVWGIIPIILSFVDLKLMFFSKVADGRPTLVIRNGVILEKNLKKSLMKAEELLMLLREKNVFDISDVELAILETNGKLSVMLKPEEQPLTPSTMGVSMKQANSPAILIVDGEVLTANLEDNNLDQEWLKKELKTYGVDRFEDVFLAQLDTKGRLYIDLYKDRRT